VHQQLPRRVCRALHPDRAGDDLYAGCEWLSRMVDSGRLSFGQELLERGLRRDGADLHGPVLQQRQPRVHKRRLSRMRGRPGRLPRLVGNTVLPHGPVVQPGELRPLLHERMHQGGDPLRR